MSCKKKQYRDKISAMIALSKCKWLGNYKPHRMEYRIYWCKECNCYHLTKQKK